MQTRKAAQLLILWAAASPLAAQFSAPERGTRAIGSPATITSPGSYILVNDIALEQLEYGITIMVDGVTLDLNGREIAGPGGKRGVGVYVNGVRSVRVRNGRITNTAIGVLVAGSANVTLTDLEIRGEGLAVVAPPPEVAVMIVQSKAVVVERNNLYNVGLGVFVRGGGSSGNRIADNTITAGTNGALGICYNPAPGDPTGPRGDLVANNLISGFTTGIQVVAASTANLFRDNTIIFRRMPFDPPGSPQDVDNAKIALP